MSRDERRPRDRARPEQPRREAPRREAPRREAPRREAPRAEAPTREAPRDGDAAPRPTARFGALPRVPRVARPHADDAPRAEVPTAERLRRTHDADEGRPTRGRGPARAGGRGATRDERGARDAKRPARKAGARPAEDLSAPPRHAPPSAAGPMRLQRALARAGIASRRHAEALIAEGRVTVNGRPAQLGQTVNPARDRIDVDGRPVGTPAPTEWFVLHKPAGVLTTRQDPDGRPTVFDLVPERPGLTYVGRLDYMTEGVLLLTTDGEGAHALTHPSREVERTYVAVVRGNATAAARRARAGVELEDGLVTPTDVEVRAIGNRRWEFEITLTEGRTREVRRLCEALDLEVERLVRVRFGPVRLGALESGQVRRLTPKELGVVEALIGKPKR